MDKNTRSKDINIALAELRHEHDEIEHKIIEAIRSKNKIKNKLADYKKFPTASFFEELKKSSIDMKTYLIMLFCSVILLALTIYAHACLPSLLGDLGEVFSAFIGAIFFFIFAIFLYINFKGIFRRNEQIHVFTMDIMLKDIEISHYEENLRNLHNKLGLDHESFMRSLQYIDPY